ncbi:SCND3 protein, partial [Polypterus senegalus]
MLKRVTGVIRQHLTSLVEYFDKYFMSEDIEAFDWTHNPFQCASSELTGRAQDELVELSSNRTLQIKFDNPATDICSFWCIVSLEYPLLSALAVKILIPFSTTYLCTVSFSALTAMKTKYRSRMNVEDDLRVCLSKSSARIDMLCKPKQHHL